MKTTTIIAIALGVGALGACHKSPNEQAAQNIESNYGNAAENVESATGNAATTGTTVGAPADYTGEIARGRELRIRLTIRPQF